MWCMSPSVEELWCETMQSLWLLLMLHSGSVWRGHRAQWLKQSREMDPSLSSCSLRIYWVKIKEQHSLRSLKCVWNYTHAHTQAHIHANTHIHACAHAHTHYKIRGISLFTSSLLATLASLLLQLKFVTSHGVLYIAHGGRSTVAKAFFLRIVTQLLFLALGPQIWLWRWGRIHAAHTSEC